MVGEVYRGAFAEVCMQRSGEGEQCEQRAEATHTAILLLLVTHMLTRMLLGHCPAGLAY